MLIASKKPMVNNQLVISRIDQPIICSHKLYLEIIIKLICFNPFLSKYEENQNANITSLEKPKKKCCSNTIFFQRVGGGPD